MENVNFGAGLQEVYVKTTEGTEYRLRGAVKAEGDSEVDEVEVKGDDEKLAKFVFGQSEAIGVTLNAITFDALQAITGNTINSSATGMDIPLGTDSEQNAPYIGLRAKSIARNEDGTAGYFEKIWYKVQFTKVKVLQAGEAELSCELEGIAYKTDEDIEENPLTPTRIADIHYWNA